jgi:hypothetical protein
VHQEVLFGAPLFFVIPANFWQRLLDIFCHGRFEHATEVLAATKDNDSVAGLHHGIPLAPEGSSIGRRAAPAIRQNQAFGPNAAKEIST